MVSPDPSKNPGPMRVTATPAASARSNTVRSGCQRRGSGPFSHERPLNTTSRSGSSIWKPTIPCTPGSSPVPREPIDVAVVLGKPQVSVVVAHGAASAPRRNGAWPARRRSNSSPKPSTRTTTARRDDWKVIAAERRGSGAPRAANTLGKTSARVCRPRARSGPSGGSLHGIRTPLAAAGATVTDRSWRTRCAQSGWRA